MAETKRARAIRAEKEQVLDQIKQLHQQARTACLSVPQRVLRGSHQDAVAWKDLAEKVLYGGSGIPQSGTLRTLLVRLSDKRETLKRLTCPPSPHAIWHADRVLTHEHETELQGADLRH